MAWKDRETTNMHPTVVISIPILSKLLQFYKLPFKRFIIGKSPTGHSKLSNLNKLRICMENPPKLLTLFLTFLLKIILLAFMKFEW